MKPIRTIAASVAGLALLAGCEQATSEGLAPSTAATTVRVVHASRDAGAARLQVDNGALTGVLNFRDTAVVTIPGGARRLRLYAAADTARAVLDATVTLVPESRNTIVVAGYVDSLAFAPRSPRPAAGNRLRLITVQDGGVVFPGTAAARGGVRVIHAAANINVVDGTPQVATNAQVLAWLFPASSGTRGSPAFGGAALALGAVSEYAPIDTAGIGPFRLEVTSNSTTAPVSRVLFNLPTPGNRQMWTAVVL